MSDDIEDRLLKKTTLMVENVALLDSSLKKLISLMNGTDRNGVSPTTPSDDVDGEPDVSIVSEIADAIKKDLGE